MYVDDDAVQRVAVTYKTTVKLAHETARNGSGRVAKGLHAEAMLVDSIMQKLIGAQAWHAALNQGGKASA